MPRKEKKVNAGLLSLSLFICLASSVLFTSSSFSPREAGLSFSGILPVKEKEETAIQGAASPKVSQASSESEVAGQEIPLYTPTPIPTRVLAESPFQVSEVAEEGVWTSSGNQWLFMVDGSAYQGWLHDTDGKTYYLGADSLMATGWITVDGNTYYMDMDGIMQTGEQEIDGVTYHFGLDGILEDSSGGSQEPQKAQEEEVKLEAKLPKQVFSPTPTPGLKPGERGAIALTFDDGPSDFTEELLATLASQGAHATFFMVGTELEHRTQIPQMMLSLGMELGNHTYNHTDLSGLTPEQIQAEVGALDQFLFSLVGQGCSVLRPPYGNVSSAMLSTIGTPMILWSVDTEDWESQDVASIVKQVKKGATDGAIILMHDPYETTLEAVKQVVPWLLEEGYELLTVHELAQRNGIELTTGVTYSQLRGEQEPAA